MTAEQARQLRPGDKVMHIHRDWGESQEVEGVDSEHFKDDPVVFFKAGGFWRASRLEKVIEPE